MEASGMTDANGMYNLTFFGTTVVAETGDELVVTASRDGVEVGSSTQTLSSDEIEAGRAMVNISTDIKASTSALAVSGRVFFEDGTIAVGAGVTVTSMNGGRGLETSGMTDADGNYSVTFFSAEGLVAETGDMISVTAVHDGEAVGSTEHMLSAAEVDAQRAEVNVITSVKASTSALVVSGTVFFDDGGIAVGAGVTVTSMNGGRGLEVSGMTDADGNYSVTFFSAEGLVAETGDMISVTAVHDGEAVGLKWSSSAPK
jgi:hypothetical protein